MNRNNQSNKEETERPPLKEEEVTEAVLEYAKQLRKIIPIYPRSEDRNHLTELINQLESSAREFNKNIDKLDRNGIKMQINAILSSIHTKMDLINIT